jgi:hypothetical protein
VTLWTPDTGPITATGIWDGMPDEVYHADPVKGGSLSHSGSKTLLDCPERFAYEQANGRAPNRHFDVGHAAHHQVLGTGPEIVVIPFDDWRSKDAKAAVKAARDRGAVPVKPAEMDDVRGMGRRLSRHKVAGPLFERDGVVERSAVWLDEEFGVFLRARFDWSFVAADGVFTIVDYKSTEGKASPAKVAKAIYDFGYYTQHVFYQAGAEVCGLGDRIRFLFVFQEKNPPYICTVAEIDDESHDWAGLAVRKAVETFARCRERGEWPDYADDIIRASLPKYATFELTARWRNGDFAIPEEI